jgi:hypothetical protein
MADLQVTRSVPTDLPVDELWALVGDGERWVEWMVDGAEIAVQPGSTGTVDDQGRRRTVVVDDVSDGRVAFTWWPEGDADRTSRVELVVLPTATGSILRITERFATSASASTVATAGIAWDVRTLLVVLAACLVATA